MPPRLTKLDMARVIVQALRRETSPAAPNDPEALTMAASRQTSQLVGDYEQARDAIAWRERERVGQLGSK